MLQLMLLLPPGDVVYLRLASPISKDARRVLIAQLANQIKPAQWANARAQQALAGSSSNAAAMAPTSRQLQQAQQAQQKVSEQ
jgi:hypothetical protein